MTVDALDPPETLLGQLQRGLGRGFVAALRGGAGKDELLRCIVHDPRWDRQVEERASYYGKLAVELGLAVEPIAEAVRNGDHSSGEGGLSADVLVEMALRGRDDALTALREELQHEGWLLALESLSGAEDDHGRQLIRPDDIRLVAGHDGEELKRIFFNTGLPWREWARSEPRLRTLLMEANAGNEPARQPPAPKPDTSMTTRELLAIVEPRNGTRVARVLAQRKDVESVAAMVDAAHGNDRNRRLAAFRALGAQGHPGLLAEVAAALEADPGGISPDRPPMLRYLEALPSDATLPRARKWLSHDGGAAIAADHILARHAQPHDRELVEATLATALDEDDIYRACSMVEALTVIADSRSTDVLVRVFERIPYAYARPRVLRALRASQSEAAGPLAAEALLDCERHARELAAQMTPMAEDARRQLEQMQQDAFEDERVRAAATSRLDVPAGC